MRHRKRSVKLDRRSGPRRRLLRNLAVDVLLRERVRTTAAKARAVRPLVERCITLGKEASLIRRRRLQAILQDDRVVRKLLEVIGPRFQTRPGGYTRVIRIGRRMGDRAEIVQLELV